jgi:peptide/nickel transport system substrate-binding protein
MARQDKRRLDTFRRTAPDPQQAFIEDALAGQFDRAELLRRASVLGVSFAGLGSIATALGGAPAASAARRAVKVGGRLRIAVPTPAKDVDPYTFSENGALQTGSITGEYLNRTKSDLTLQPELALSWTPNANGSAWTFKLRPNVKFQTGAAFGADDVVATFKRLTDPKGGSQALSAFQGVLVPSGISKVDELTVRFTLQAPNVSFPYLTSSATYQAIILPADYQIGTFTTTPQTTGAFSLTNYSPGVGATYERFDGWWKGSAPLDGVDVTYYTQDPAAVNDLLAGNVDLVPEVQLATGRALFTSPNVKILKAHGASHREIPLRNDVTPLNDYRVRQAIALSLDRPSIVTTLFDGQADLGNDSPFAPIYPVTDTSVPQRKQNLALAKQLLAAAGVSSGFSQTLTTYQTAELPELAQIVQSAVKPLGIDLKLSIETSQQYYGGTNTTTPWLNDPITITDWGHRPVPNVFLEAGFTSKGIWNAAHYKSTAYDALYRSYAAALTLTEQRKYAKQIELLLLHDTPVVIPYFFYWLAGASTKLQGYVPDPSAGVYVSGASLA